jgi:hypothetical protein
MAPGKKDLCQPGLNPAFSELLLEGSMSTLKRNFHLSKTTYPVDSFDSLNCLLPGKFTNELVSIISLNVVQCGVRVYRIMREIGGS